MHTSLLSLASLVLNLPFGFYRYGVRKFSWRWFLAIHLPVPAVIILRLATGAPWSIIPLLIAAAVIGQLLGAALRQRLWPAGPAGPGRKGRK